MRKKKAEISRLKDMIDRDRTSCSNEFFELVLSDVNRVVSEYFDIKKKADLTAERRGEEVDITITFSAIRLKKFGTVPK